MSNFTDNIFLLVVKRNWNGDELQEQKSSLKKKLSFIIEDTFRWNVLQTVCSTDGLKEKKSWKWSLRLR